MRGIVVRAPEQRSRDLDHRRLEDQEFLLLKKNENKNLLIS